MNTQDIAAEISALKGEKPASAPDKEIEEPKTEKVKKGGYKKKGGNGGAREGAGRMPGGTAEQKRAQKQLVRDHINEVTDITVVDRATGKQVTVKKPRILAAMEKLFQIGMKDGDANALDRWLNRALGKPAQPIIGGDEDDAPVSVKLGVSKILKKLHEDGDV